MENNSGTGFFIDYNSNKYLITNYHVISKEKEKIEIEIWDKSNIELDLNNRYIIYILEPKDITIISLKNNEIDKIEYLFFDLNYSIGYNYYNEKDILSAWYPKGKKLAAGSGIIKEIINEYEFYHNIPTEHGLSGSPIILLNSLTVIGIHKQADIEKNLNVGTFIGEAIKSINEKKFIKIINFKKRNSSIDQDIIFDIKKNKNEINCVYIIKENKEINLLYDFTENVNNFNFEESKRAHNEAKKIINEKNIDIYINDIKIKSNQKYKRNETGTINVKFKFKKLLTSTGFMFYKYTALKSIYLSLFNSSNVTNMYDMFNECSSLESIDLSSFNTNNVTDMNTLFSKSSCLQSIDLSSFNTNNVTDMSFMFNGCSSLESIDLSSFNTNNVTNMKCMFDGCSSLKSIDLSSFKTNKVTNMRTIFQQCSSLKSIDLSSFNTNNVTDMSFMFNRCF